MVLRFRSMNDPARFAIVLALSITFASACSNSDDVSGSGSSGDGESTDDTYTFSDNCFDSIEQTEIMPCLAGNLLSTLDSDDQALMLNDFTEENAVDHWSDLPLENPANIERNGIALEDMDTVSKEAAEILLDAALSTQGQDTMDSLRAADQFLSENANAMVYGEDKYAVAFLGTPSETESWAVVLSGHHYTFFASFDESAISATPYFVAVEPVSFESGGETIMPMAKHRDALISVFDSLSNDELGEALLAGVYDDVLVGPQQDGDYPEVQEGLLVGDLIDVQKALVADAIRAYADDANGTDQSDRYTSDAALDATYIAYASGDNLDTAGDYARIDGPEVWIEFTVQDGAEFSNPHYHSIWRDKELDYGGRFAF